MFFQVYRRFYNKLSNNISIDHICLFDDLDKVLEFINNEEDKTDDNLIHIDTYAVSILVNNIYPNIQKLKKIAKKTFTTSEDLLYNIITQ
jgi:hypothetical protein